MIRLNVKVRSLLVDVYALLSPRSEWSLELTALAKYMVTLTHMSCLRRHLNSYPYRLPCRKFENFVNFDVFIAVIGIFAILNFPRKKKLLHVQISRSPRVALLVAQECVCVLIRVFGVQ